MTIVYDIWDLLSRKDQKKFLLIEFLIQWPVTILMGWFLPNFLIWMRKPGSMGELVFMAVSLFLLFLGACARHSHETRKESYWNDAFALKFVVVATAIMTLRFLWFSINYVP